MSQPEPRLESRACPLGCAAEDRFVLTGRDRLHGLPGEFRVVRCSACGLLRTDPRPAPGSIGAFYPDEYGPYLGTRVDRTPDTRPRWRRAASRALRRWTDTRAEALPDLPPGRLLEIGCASGAFLDHMARAGWDVEGIEFSEKPAAEARALGYRVHTGSLETAPPPREKYDLVVGWMVLEHLHEPVRALAKMREWTRPSGWLALSVPNAGSYELALFRDAWYALQLPTHLYHFDRKTLARLLDAGGWRVERITGQRDLKNLFASAGYALEDRGVAPRLARWLREYPERGGRLPMLLHPAASLLALAGQAGRMTVWARPRG